MHTRLWTYCWNNRHISIILIILFLGTPKIILGTTRERLNVAHALHVVPSASSLVKIQPLNKTNYQIWIQEIHAVLRGKGLWRLISEQEKKHSLNANKQEEWDDKAAKACSLLTLRVEQSQRIIFQNVSNNPIKIWTTLEAAHVQRCPVMSGVLGCPKVLLSFRGWLP